MSIGNFDFYFLLTEKDDGIFEPSIFWKKLTMKVIKSVPPVFDFPVVTPDQETE